MKTSIAVILAALGLAYWSPAERLQAQTPSIQQFNPNQTTPIVWSNPTVFQCGNTNSLYTTLNVAFGYGFEVIGFNVVFDPRSSGNVPTYTVILAQRVQE